MHETFCYQPFYSVDKFLQSCCIMIGTNFAFVCLWEEVKQKGSQTTMYTFGYYLAKKFSELFHMLFCNFALCLSLERELSTQKGSHTIMHTFGYYLVKNCLIFLTCCIVLVALYLMLAVG